MRVIGFRYVATTAAGREIRSYLWLPAFIPPAPATQLVSFMLRRAFAKVTTLALEPALSLRARPDNVAMFTRRLAVMVAAGISLHGAINFLSESEDDDMNAAASKLSGMITTGNSFAHSLALMPGVFPPVFVGFARAGESSGRLVQALEALAVQMERSVWMRRRIRSALGYPFFLAVGAILLCGLLIFGIVPMMAPTLQQMNVELPWLTRALLRFTEVGSHPLVFVTVALVGFVTSTVLGFIMSPTGRFTRARRHIDQLLLSLPITDRLSQQYASARVLSAAGMSVETGIPVTKALLEASCLAPNTLIEERIIRICDTIAEGAPFEEALDAHGAFTIAETQIMICSSEAGDMAGGMTRMAKEAEEQVEATITVLTSLVEPIILGVMSVVVGVVSLATFLPWVNLLQSIL